MIAITSPDMAHSGGRLVAFQSLIIIMAIATLPKEIALLAAAAFIVLNWTSVPWKETFPLIGLYLFVVLISETVGAVLGNTPYALFKDFYFLSVLPVFFLSGVIICRRLDDDAQFRLLALAALVSGTLLVARAHSWQSTAVFDRQKYRALLGYETSFSIFCVPSAIRKIFQPVARRADRLLAIIALISGVASTLVSQSRTQLLFFALALILSVIKFPVKKFEPVIAPIFFAILVLGTPIYLVAFGGIRSLEKPLPLPIFLAEWVPYPYSSMRDINLHWRAYEGFAAYKQWTQEPWIEKLFGQGAGSQVGLGLEMHLGKENFYEVPILHNGLMYGLTKLGVFGLFYLAAQMLNLAIITRGSRDILSKVSLRFVALLYVVLSFPAFGGFFNGREEGSAAILVLGMAAVSLPERSKLKKRAIAPRLRKR